MDPSYVGSALQVLAKQWATYIIIFTIFFLNVIFPQSLRNTLLVREVANENSSLVSQNLKRVEY